MHNQFNRNYPVLKKALLIVHQKRSDPGAIGQKLKDRGYELDIRRPVLGDELPSNMEDHDLVVIFGGGERNVSSLFLGTFFVELN